jgi:hypothetical protein
VYVEPTDVESIRDGVARAARAARAAPRAGPGWPDVARRTRAVYEAAS